MSLEQALLAVARSVPVRGFSAVPALAGRVEGLGSAQLAGTTKNARPGFQLSLALLMLPLLLLLLRFLLLLLMCRYWKMPRALLLTMSTSSSSGAGPAAGWVAA